MPRRRATAFIFFACGVWLILLGIYFVFLRPPLLPEDARYIGMNLGPGESAPLGLTRWLRHVFAVMGGFMIATGVLTTFLAATVVSRRQRGTGVVLLLAGLASVATMSATNFAIDSHFRWLLLAPAVLWCLGLAAYAFEPRGPYER